MGTTALRQLLRSLCTNSDWNYAVFWKLRLQNPKLLAWEDGYCGHPKPSTPMEILANIPYAEGTRDMSSSDDESDLIHGCANQYEIGRVVADISCLQYTMGEGLVGKVACTGNECWISSDDISANQFKYDEPFEFPDEWLPQFLAGIKTVLLVPVLPHGVLQLGSLEVVDEDPAVADHVKERFYAYRIVAGISSSSASKKDSSLHASLALIASLMGEMDEPSSITYSPGDKLLPEGSEGSTNTNECDMLTLDTDIPLQEILEDAKEIKDSVSLIPIHQPLELSQSELLQNEQFSESYLGEDLPGFSKYCSLGVSEKFSTRAECRGDEGDDAENTGFEELGSMFDFPVESELYRALGPALHSQISGYPEDGYLSIGDLHSSSCFINSLDFHFIDSHDFLGGMEPSVWELEEFPGRGEAEELLESVISNLYGSGDDRSPSSDDLKPSTTSDYQFAASSKLPTKSETAVEGDYSVPWIRSGATVDDMNGNVSTKRSTLATLRSVPSTVNDKELPNGYPCTQAREGKKNLTGGKRKSRAGDNQRPRPRDRQLIQDRVKELRELVPNGSKCSIDALLDRTIKHMAFLRGVTNQAEKLRKCVPPKESKPKIWRSLGIEDDNHRGKSGVFDFGSEFQVYPIVVEDLEYPGHLLIEMLCDEQGLFLEIAQVIRRLDLTILKGVMENRADNTWARFVVEASKGFQRTDIFWPLMQVLQRRGNPISTGV